MDNGRHRPEAAMRLGSVLAPCVSSFPASLRPSVSLPPSLSPHLPILVSLPLSISLLKPATALWICLYIFVTTVLTWEKVHFFYIQFILKANRTRAKFILHYQILTLPVITLTFRPIQLIIKPYFLNTS